ncbi:MAG: efflux RND transporter permease subunit [Gemmatimonadetes bacterium]|nr:efflux RND transporter permease subunit [Gemmatimonadota bacterium]
MVTGIVMMRIGENARTVVGAVKEKFEAAKSTLPDGVTMKPFYDRTELIDRTIGTVERNLLEGAALVVAVLFLLLGNLRAALIVALAIPLSMLFAFSAMLQAGIAGSLMSLGAIDFGLVVDGSVVMVENAMRHLGEREHKKRGFLETVRFACGEVSRPILFGVGIIIVVYLPILSLEGVEGKLFRPMALTVVFAVAGSLLLTFLLTPVLIAFGLRGPIVEKDVWFMRHAKRIYQPAREWTLAHSRRSAGAVGRSGRTLGRGHSISRIGFIPDWTKAHLPSRSCACRASRSRSRSGSRRSSRRACERRSPTK